MAMDTLRRRLFKRLLWPLIPILLVGAVFAYLFALHAAMTAYDFGLLNDAVDLSRQVAVRQGRLSIDLPLAAQEMLQVNNQDRETYAAWDESGNLFSGNPKLLQLREPIIGNTQRFADLALDREENRAVILRQWMGGKG